MRNDLEKLLCIRQTNWWFYRLAEGASTGLSCLMTWRRSLPVWLRATYLIHWMMSLFFHWAYSPISHQLDRLLIQLLICERSSHPLLLRLLFLGSLGGVRPMALIATLLMTRAVEDPAWYLVCQASTLVFNALSDWCLLGPMKKQLRWSTLCVVLFHASLAGGSFWENGGSLSIPDTRLHIVLRYACYLMASFRAIEIVASPSEARMSRICTLITSILLSMVGLHELLMLHVQIPPPFHSDMELMLYDDPPRPSFDYHVHVACFYLAYVLVDGYLGLTRFASYFRWLEGVVHHLFTGTVVLASLLIGDPRPISLSLIVEIPTIVLCARHFISIPHPVFPFLFVLFRILLLGYVVLLAYHQNIIGTGYVLVYLLFTGVNGYWLWRMMLQNSAPSSGTRCHSPPPGTLEAASRPPEKKETSSRFLYHPSVVRAVAGTDPSSGIDNGQ